MRERHLWLLLVPLFLLTFALAARGLDADPIWGDEYLSTLDAGGHTNPPRSLVEIWQGVAARNPNHAPGFYMLLSGWARWVGWDPVALRVLALLLGLLAMAWVYRLGRLLVSPRVGLYAAIVLGTAAFFIHYLHEIRMYSLFVLLAAFGAWAYFRAVNTRRPPGIWNWIALFVAALASLYSDYLAALPWVVLGLYHLLVMPKNRRWWQATGVLALAAVFFLPWIDAFIAGLGRAAANEGLQANALDPAQLVARIAWFVTGGFPLLLVTLVPALLWARGRGARAIGFLALGLLLVFVVFNIVVRVVEEHRMRYVLSFWPMLALLAGLALAQLCRWRWLTLVAVALWIGFGVRASLDATFTSTQGGYAEQFPLQWIARTVGGWFQPEDLMINYLPDEGPPISRYYRLANYYYTPLRINEAFVKTFDDPQMQNNQVRDTMSAVDDRARVWLAWMPDRPTRTLDDFRATLEQDYQQCNVWTERPDLRVEQYARTRVCCLSDASATATRLRFGDSIRLVDVEPLPDLVQTDTVPISILWALAADVPPNEHSVSLQLLDSAGEKVAQADYGLLPMAYTCQQAELNVSDLAPGEYTLMVIVYRWQTGERLSGQVTATVETGDVLPLTTVRIGASG